jgi:glutamine---fructose-6-phosphate transaminase (isomerizing)
MREVFDMGMAGELREAPDAVRAQAGRLAEPIAELVTRLHFWPPSVVVTCARGSSAHAASFAKHLIERYLGIPVAAAAPNIASVYRRKLNLEGQLFLAVSQSGRSDDLVANAAMARESGALTAALVNDTGSPLAAVCDIVLPICSGPEHGVAATKTFVASLAALSRLIANWAENRDLAAAIERLPERLARAGDLDWSAAVEPIAAAPSLIAIGRGPTLAIAREAALKLKEIANRHAEAFSGAEFLALLPTDAAGAGMRALVHDLAVKGAAVLAACSDGALPVLAPDHPATDAICLIQAFYAMMVQLAARLDINPDRPRHLQKITSTR